MADISKVTLLNGSTYDIKDASAHSKIATIEGKEAGWDAKAEVSDIDSKISAHNSSSVAHTDIRNAIPEVLDNVTSTATGKSLSANQGKLLNDRINNLALRSRFLSLWNCVTGLPLTNPSGYPYAYKTGDFFIVNTVGGTNYIPNGSSYEGTPSTTVYSGAIKPNDTIFYDGTSWIVSDTPVSDVTVRDVYVGDSSVLSGGVAYVPEIPEDLGDLNDDAAHRLVTDTEKSTWNAKIGEAPTDGKNYSRNGQTHTWVESAGGLSAEDAGSAVDPNPINADTLGGHAASYFLTSDNVIDGLNSTSTTNALSANKGRELNQKIGTLELKNEVVDVVANFSSFSSYDESTLLTNDIIKIIADENRDNASTYWKFSLTTPTSGTQKSRTATDINVNDYIPGVDIGYWIYMGKQGPYAFSESPIFTGTPSVAANTSYATAMMRNVVLSTSEPTSSQGSNGDIWIVYSN